MPSCRLDDDVCFLPFCDESDDAEDAFEFVLRLSLDPCLPPDVMLPLDLTVLSCPITFLVLPGDDSGEDAALLLLATAAGATAAALEGWGWGWGWAFPDAACRCMSTVASMTDCKATP